MKKYCLGFVFNRKLQEVLLVKKTHAPEHCDFLKDKLNGIGGAVEEGETSLEAMSREGVEEACLHCNWTQFATLRAKFGHIDCFYTVTDDIYYYHQHEDEPLKIYSLDRNGILGGYENFNPMPNLKWLIPMALNHYNKLDSTDVFVITETYK